MDVFSTLFHALLPALGIALLIIGIKIKHINYIIGTLWLSLIAIVLHYQAAGGEILGGYFGYFNAALYTINVLILTISVVYVFFHLPVLQRKNFRYLNGFVSASIVIGSALLLLNLWINAFFIETRRSGTPLMQVATFTKLPYCNYRYVFYKVGTNGDISYMCPNYYGIVPSIGHLQVSPDFLLNQMTRQAKTEPKP